MSDAVAHGCQFVAGVGVRPAPRPQRQRLVEHIAEPSVDVPPSTGVELAGQRVHHHRRVVAHRRGGPGVAVHAGDVQGDLVPECREQPGQGPVELEAVPTAGGAGDAFHRRRRFDPPAFAEVDPERLVGDALDVGAVDACERFRRRVLGVDAEAGEVRGEDGTAAQGAPSVVAAPAGQDRGAGGRAGGGGTDHGSTLRTMWFGEQVQSMPFCVDHFRSSPARLPACRCHR